ncbi:hypothetical protein Bca52824_052370 [Brassica carinata]|uniref:F-box domain-containing protein n=1 Tax=Brassica carinata TaxID=52824 RepID=A0A8X7R353_BRACI|nr:hypothetical protein Bca52824_052370 [Brassica carinata]
MWWNCTNKWKKSSSPPCALSLLPDDILLNCFATVSRSDHASLSLVNKWLRSLLLSPELYQERTLMGCTENCIFLFIHESVVREEKKVFSLNEKGNGLLYIPREGIWKKGKSDAYRPRRGWHVIENVMYCCVTGGRILWCQASELEWHEPNVIKWREVMGLKDLKDTLCASKLVNYGWGLLEEQLDDLLPGHKLSNSGPNMLLFWDVHAPGKLEIFCAEISLQRRKEKGEIWGNLEWSEVVTTLVPPHPLPEHQHHCKILHSLTLNL